MMSTSLSNRRQQAQQLLDRFADQTGLTNAQKPNLRYLWTDAFAVCNFLGIARITAPKEEQLKCKNCAKSLVDSVHLTLSQYDSQASRSSISSGWLPGASVDHPTIAGLRIGKKLAECSFGKPYDSQLEWDCDGQYFHYLT